MAKQGTYYIGRVLKFGALDQAALLAAIRAPKAIRFRGSAWSLVDVEEHQGPQQPYVFGKLSKYAPEGEVGVVDMATRSTRTQIEPNLLVASSPFVYIPSQSGIAFLNVPGQIDQRTFVRRFCDVIENSLDAFFVSCDIELVSDLKSFAMKLSSLDSIYRVEARISPPNPLFGPLWKHLEEYLRGRNADRMTLVEDAANAESLQTDLPNLVDRVAHQSEDSPFIPDKLTPIGDAAVLMAADGYGRGVIRGRRRGEVVVIKTSETTINFSFSKAPDPHELYLKAFELFSAIEAQRHMEHGR